MVRRRVIVAIVAMMLLWSSGLSQSAALASEDKVDCKVATVAFARGSGQDLNAQESRRFRDQLESRIGKSNLNFYELGTAAHGGYQYPAVDVANWTQNTNAIGAKLSSGRGLRYGRSVNSGVYELHKYLLDRQSKCPQEYFILGGYSQGAQVVGQMLSYMKDVDKKRIIFNALFGDPKLHLPEGKGFNPPACRNEYLSLYRREIANCDVDNGSLGARKPYVSNIDAGKTGLWCLAQDFVCGSTKTFLENDGHEQYAINNGPIDDAAREAASRLKDILQKEGKKSFADTIDNKPKNNNLGTAGTDVVFMLDTTGSMSGIIDQTKQFIRHYSEQIKEIHGRVGLVVYRDKGDEYTAQKLSDLQPDTTHMLQQLDSVRVDGGGDGPEAVLHAAMTTLNTMKWKQGATKAIILLTDAGYHSPDKVDGTTLEAVAKRSLEIDPVNIYPVTPRDSEQYRLLAEQTSGQVIVSQGDSDGVIRGLTAALTKIKNRPNVKLKIGAYRADIGQAITFDASDSYVVDGKITKYEWDFDGDGTIDRVTDSPVAKHSYQQKFDGVMQVRMWADNDTIANISAPVKVGVPKEERTLPTAPKLSAKVVKRENGKATVRLSIEPTNNLADSWLVRQDDDRLGSIVGNQQQVDIEEVEARGEATFGVRGATSDGYVGKESFVTVTFDTPSNAEPGSSSHSGGSIEGAVRRCPYGFTISPVVVDCQYKKVQFGRWSFSWIAWHVRWKR